MKEIKKSVIATCSLKHTSILCYRVKILHNESNISTRDYNRPRTVRPNFSNYIFTTYRQKRCIYRLQTDGSLLEHACKSNVVLCTDYYRITACRHSLLFLTTFLSIEFCYHNNVNNTSRKTGTPVAKTK